MKYLFIDNFRGFSNAYIPIVDVNFLVGENSTGKTSVLGLLKLLSSPQFLFGQDFGDPDVNFGTFTDMVSAHSDDRSYFRVGVIQEEAVSKGKTTIRAALFSYREDSGLPRLTDFSYVSGPSERHLRFTDDGTLFSANPVNQSSSVESARKYLMPRWVNRHKSKDSSYSILDLPKELRQGPIPLILALGAVTQRLASKGKGSTHNGLQMVGPLPFEELVWVAPIRTKPRRTYDELRLEFSPDGLHTPYLIRRLLDPKAKSAPNFRRFMRKIGKASGLFESIDIRSFGLGDEVTAPFEVDAILDGKPLNLSTVGYGVSQSLPVLVELLARPRGSFFAIQQPEVHLHPRAQAALGDVLFEMATQEHKSFLVETHSDFTIDRFRMNYRGKVKPKIQSNILFFERRKKTNTVSAIKIGAQGNLPSRQPDGYRRFFLKEEMRVLGL